MGQPCGLGPIAVNLKQRMALLLSRTDELCAVSCCSQAHVPKVISMNVLLFLHTQSLSAQKEAGIFYSEWGVLVKPQTVARKRGRGVELVYFEGLAVHYSAILVAESQTCQVHLLQHHSSPL